MEAHASNASGSAGKWSPSSDASDIVKNIHAMLHPRNIVLVGATDKPGNYAERIWNNLIKYKFAGGLYPVNSKRETIWGVPCYKDFASLPDKPDHVLVLVPARFAVQVIRDAAAAGARSATIVTSGFSELQDDESQKLAAELQQAIRDTGLAVTGPNCLGNLSAGENLFTNIDDRIVTMEAGSVAIAGQSGAIVMAIRQALEDRGVGVGYMVTTGNEAGLETPDLMSYFAADPSHPRHRGLSRGRAEHEGVSRGLQGRPRRRQAGDRAQARGIGRRPRRGDGPYRRARRIDRNVRCDLDPRGRDPRPRPG